MVSHDLEVFEVVVLFKMTIEEVLKRFKGLFRFFLVFILDVLMVC